jgi:hypothetical protein
MPPVKTDSGLRMQLMARRWKALPRSMDEILVNSTRVDHSNALRPIATNLMLSQPESTDLLDSMQVYHGQVKGFIFGLSISLMAN